MSPADIDQHTRDIRALLDSKTESKTVPREACVLNPYDAIKDENADPTRPLTFGWYFGVPKDQTKEEKERWAAVESCFRMSLQETYPDAGVARLEFQVPDRNLSFFFSVQAHAKLRRSIRGNLVLIDTDVLAYNRCDTIFDADFDIGLTDSSEFWPLMPFNGGIIFSKDTPKAQLFLDTWMEVSCDVPQNFHPLYISQCALRVVYDKLKDDVNIKIFPHEAFNYTPETLELGTDAYFLHFKGNRKPLMIEYARAMALRGKNDPN